jgi:RNA polymerase sigma-70 factor (ECF subfamily)
MMESSREARLVLLARSGDRDSLELLLSGIQSRLLSYISAIVGRTSADDVLQDTFLQICRNLRWLRDPGLFAPWAYRIASRASFAHLKRERRYQPADQQTVLPDEITSPSQPEPQLFCGVPELLAEISPASRAVLNLHYVQDLPLAEVAAVLDISIGTAKSRMAYGLACLREILKGKNHDSKINRATSKITESDR